MALLSLKRKWAVGVVDFLIYAGVLIHLSMLLPSPLGSGGQDISIHLAFLLLLITRELNFKKLFSNKLSLFFLLFFASLALSTFLYSEFPEVLRALRSRSKGVTLFFAVQMLSVSNEKKDNLFALALFPLFLIYMTLSSYIPFFLGIEYPGRTHGFLWALGRHQNFTAMFWNIALPATVGTFLILKEKRLKVLLGFFILATLVGIPLTLSRGGMIAMFFSVIALSAALLKKDTVGIYMKRWGKYLLAVFAGALLVLSLFSSNIVDEFTTADWVSMTGRSNNIWPYVLESVRERPIFGYGARTFRKVFPDFSGRKVNHAHSMFFQTLFEGGVFGMIIFLFLCVVFIRYAWGVYRREKGSIYGFSFIVALTAVAGVHGIVATLRYIPFSFVLSSIWLHQAYEKLKTFPEKASENLLNKNLYMRK